MVVLTVVLSGIHGGINGGIKGVINGSINGGIKGGPHGGSNGGINGGIHGGSNSVSEHGFKMSRELRSISGEITHHGNSWLKNRAGGGDHRSSRMTGKAG
jgi:hypothetical protein